MSDFFAGVAVLLLGMLVYQTHRLMALNAQQAERLRTISSSAAMLFHAVEQIYEMSGIHERFNADTSNMGDVKPRADVDDRQSKLANETFVARIQHRMEWVVRERQRHMSQQWPRDERQLMIRANQATFVAQIPVIENWPPHEDACWWRIGERPNMGIGLR